uniref:Sushi domain containing 6 n=1 Tax=Hucho hucho TaxID=62062 RepID=A0A4W5K4T4_9TELE
MTSYRTTWLNKGEINQIKINIAPYGQMLSSCLWFRDFNSHHSFDLMLVGSSDRNITQHHTTRNTGWHAITYSSFSSSPPSLIHSFFLLHFIFSPHPPSRREQGVSGQPASMVVEGVQVALPSYEEAVYGSGGASLPPPPESRVQIVLSEGPQGAEGGAEGPSSRSQSHHHRDTELCLPSSSSSSSRRAETVLVHQAPSCSSSSSSSWVTEHGGGACGGVAPLVTLARRRDSESSDQHSLLSVTSVDDFYIPLLKEA